MNRRFQNNRPVLKWVCTGGMVLILMGCASFSRDGGFDAVTAVAQERLGRELIWARTEADQSAIAQRVATLLSQPLDVNDAVQIALLNNRGLQAAFAELTLSEADLVQAGRLPNPGLGVLRTSPSGDMGRDYKIEQTFTFNLLSLLTMPQRRDMAQRSFEQTQRMVSLEVLRLASETRKAYYKAVAAQESVRYAQQVQQAAQAGAELARRMVQVGNFNQLQQAREQSFYAEAALGVARTERALTSAREQLTRLLGLWGTPVQFTLPQRLPDLPQAPNDWPDIEQQAMAQRLDIHAARLHSEALAKNLGLTKTTRWINVLEIGGVREREGRKEPVYKRGYEVSVELPLFDWGTAKVAKAEALYMQSVHVAAQTAINARSEVREAYRGYRTSYDVARHYRDEIVPLKKRISEQSLLRYNGMLMGVFDLLADAREQITTVNSAIEALRDFWVAQSDLEMALIGQPMLANAPGNMPAGRTD